MLNTLTIRALLLCVTTTAFPTAAYFEGDGTTYTLGGVSSGNCNLMSWNSIAATNYAALNNEQWNNLGNCGRCAQVSCIDEACEDQTATAIVQIVDRCPECKYGDLDLSPSVFRTITGSDPSRLSIRWQFVDCPNPETLKICLKTGSNGFWIAVQPTNAVIGVKSVSINGNTASMISGAYYYLITSSSEVDLTAVEVSVTSMDGQVIEGMYSLSAGQCTDTNLQFETTSATPATTNPTTAPSTSAPTVVPTTTAPPTIETTAPTTTAPPATTAPIKCYMRRSRH
ncbi:hypothetical protein PPTG_12538 [Phytophthora nicotianae INRA-310]|uniref:Expansin-like EG45 domain-containing protein n=1 Tax=Phytophthora nicotianae (strain INRA-310) TaxID=761204 RepID=W2Q6Z1_PHYN3|nr:hypothetical protein PPTG_12538 [Phytophthora nicotianae INRA-310]ETN08025.1 hypothetical protein PPTG_12538 [Phytophthora nicotianae INRA-310]